MTNRLNELKKNLPKSKIAIDNLINCIASFSNGNIDDDILNRTLTQLREDIEAEQRD